MTTDPAPRFTGPDAAFDALADWGRKYRRLMAERDPLVRGALVGPLAGHGYITASRRATRLTRQTLTRIRSREEIPVLAEDHSLEVDWDEYADYLDALAEGIEVSLARIAGPQTGEHREFTADDLRARVLRDLAARVRDTEWTDLGYWALTVSMREEAADRADPTAVLQEDSQESQEGPALRSAQARALSEVADQITRYRIEGPAAVVHLDADTLARARAHLPMSARQLAESGGPGPEAAR